MSIIRLPGMDPWANLTVPYPGDDATPAQLFSFATLSLLNALLEGVPTDRNRALLRRTTVAYLEEWHPEIEAPPL